MENMEHWEIALLLLVGYLAVSALVRLMAWHRDEVVAKFRRDLDEQKTSPKAQERDPSQQRRAG